MKLFRILPSFALVLGGACLFSFAGCGDSKPEGDLPPVTKVMTEAETKAALEKIDSQRGAYKGGPGMPKGAGTGS